jgi:hypothetical protein
MNFDLPKYLKALLWINFVFLISCNKEENIIQNTTINFNGITKTDEQGVPITLDSTDWNIKDVWMLKEQALFPNQYKTDCKPDWPYTIVLYPNPNNGYLAMSLNMPDDARLDIRLVDRFYNVLLSKDSIDKKQIIFDVKNQIPKDTLRMYYKFVNSGCEFRGHGDIIIN